MIIIVRNAYYFVMKYYNTHIYFIDWNVIVFNDNTECMLSCEFLRVYSPSAEVRGHGAGQEVLQVGKENVNILAIEPVGQYAIKLIFSDGHDTGLYSWDYLYELARNYEGLWLEYIGKLDAAGVKRNPIETVQ
jgi:DUF971 family protein